MLGKKKTYEVSATVKLIVEADSDAEAVSEAKCMIILPSGSDDCTRYLDYHAKFVSVAACELYTEPGES